MGFVQRVVLMVEVDGDTAAHAVERLSASLPGDAVVWGECEPTAAALLVLEQHLPTA
jgi:hypothetical protein